jgi:hypothetical protein
LYVLVGGKSSGLLQQLVHHGGLAMVNVGDDGDVTEGARHNCLNRLGKKARILA